MFGSCERCAKVLAGLNRLPEHCTQPGTNIEELYLGIYLGTYLGIIFGESFRNILKREPVTWDSCCLPIFGHKRMFWSSKYENISKVNIAKFSWGLSDRRTLCLRKPLRKKNQNEASFCLFFLRVAISFVPPNTVGCALRQLSRLSKVWIANQLKNHYNQQFSSAMNQFDRPGTRNFVYHLN